MAQILVVEDNSVMAEAICDVLESAGHQTSIAHDGVDGLVAIPKVGPDLIISDVMMPRMDGFEFYQAVRADPAWVFIPFVFLTARSEREDILLGKRLGADDYLVKPFSPDELLLTVESRLARARAISRAAGTEMKSMKQAITQVVSHELRTPLTWMQGYAELLLEGASSMTPEEFHLSLQSIKKGSDRLAQLVEDAVMMIMLDSGQAKEEYALMAKVEQYLILQIQQVMEKVASQASQHGVKLELQAPEEVSPVVLAPRFFAEALARILDNSIKFARHDVDSYAIVSVVDRDDEVEITVSDNGVGIPDDQIEQIFMPFVQVDRPQWEQQGMGMGLAVARGLIELHGGRVWAESQAGQGTQIHITLPHA